MSVVRTWPTANNFPQGPAVGSWNSKRQSNKISNKPELGPPLERRRGRVSLLYASFSLILTDVQRTEIDSFYFDKCCEGMIPFYFVNPETGVTEIWRWDDSPTVSMINKDVYQVGCSLRRDY